MANLEARYTERDAQGEQDAARSREKYNRLVEDHNSMLANYRTLLMSVPPDTFSGNPSLLADYNAVLSNMRAREGE